MAEIVNTSPSGSLQRGSYQAARVVNILLGVWLFISAFAWRHTQAQMTNTWIVAVVTVAIALLAFGVAYVRYVNTALSAWLFISAFLLPTTGPATVWNNALVAIALFIVSLIPAASDTGLAPPRSRVSV